MYTDLRVDIVAMNNSLKQEQNYQKLEAVSLGPPSKESSNAKLKSIYLFLNISILDVQRKLYSPETQRTEWTRTEVYRDKTNIFKTSKLYSSSLWCCKHAAIRTLASQKWLSPKQVCPCYNPISWALMKVQNVFISRRAHLKNDK